MRILKLLVVFLIFNVVGAYSALRHKNSGARNRWMRDDENAQGLMGGSIGMVIKKPVSGPAAKNGGKS
ncbi:uncharacterized protein CELE_C32E8.13 [Caenorhabditis elegans]|uniref:Uncharacterized protein n=1 Tax=Caenorhabditis elegans TaxID=6239 RepID=A0A2K5ATM1_CAEEL|nr:Uncharacterized protein CELE_C32E8.13 [Caenorhabditis elegans]SPC47117.1 Uncharacterized protein CELE_C32E8.13 [Caenorhabditis elegans]|eukprot:NP_001348665.1 Uncharacterized protein CELE_C32E8.13 [Caenorhabditis elegans]